MTHPEFSAKALTEVLSSAGGAFAVVFFFVIFQYIFKQEFFCPCDPDENIYFCMAYIFLPFIIFALIIIVVDKIFLEICAFPKCTSSWVMVKRILRALCVGTLWIITALLDGDLLVCYATTSRNITMRSEQPLCKKEPTSDEFSSIRHWESTSRVTGLALLCVILLVWIVFSIICKRNKSFNKTVYEEVVLEETENLLHSKLKTMAKEKANSDVEEKWNQMMDNGGYQHATNDDAQLIQP
ncbi:hypothetical protein NFI96_015376 [Prochilodus magdalenae]|nr:hypothetical protein NFI96_015376 [Prochilodus magdalenae]